MPEEGCSKLKLLTGSLQGSIYPLQKVGIPQAYKRDLVGFESLMLSSRSRSNSSLCQLLAEQASNSLTRSMFSPAGLVLVRVDELLMLGVYLQMRPL